MSKEFKRFLEFLMFNNPKDCREFDQSLTLGLTLTKVDFWSKFDFLVQVDFLC